MQLEHLQRIEDGMNEVYHLQNLADWVEKHVYLGDAKIEFGARYGFQKDIINDTSRVTNTVKPAQIGMTVSTMSYLLAACCTQKSLSVIYGLPTATDASKLVTTKLNPLINGSPEIKRLLNPDVHSTELKEVNKNFIFIRGTKSDTAALSISADLLVVDEIDRCDPDTLKQFRSRLQASNLQIIRQFSTPTIKGVGISREAETSKRFRHMCKCARCNYYWLPSYSTDILIPRYYNQLKELTAYNLKDVEWEKARWNCPNCGRDPEMHPDRLTWVCENELDNYEAHTHFVTPVTACMILTPKYLVRTSTEYKKRSEWENQVLGEVSEDSNDQVTLKDIESSHLAIGLDSSEYHVMGFDMGLMCAVTIGRKTQDGTFLVVHREFVPLSQFEKRRLELIALYRVVASVHDVYPHTNEIMKVCEYDANAYGAMFTQARMPEMYRLVEKDEDKEEGTLNLRLLKVNRTAMLDSVMELFKSKKVVFAHTGQDFKPQYFSLKRTQVFVKDELVYVWQKTDGEDHMHFALGYCYLAWEMRGRQEWSIAAPTLVSTFKVAQKSGEFSTLALG